jgi:hypothetical protein
MTWQKRKFPFSEQVNVLKDVYLQDSDIGQIEVSFQDGAWYALFYDLELDFKVASRADGRRLVSIVLSLVNDNPITSEDIEFINSIKWFSAAEVTRTAKRKAKRLLLAKQQDERDAQGNDATSCDGCGADFDNDELCICQFM